MPVYMEREWGGVVWFPSANRTWVLTICSYLPLRFALLRCCSYSQEVQTIRLSFVTQSQNDHVHLLGRWEMGRLMALWQPRFSPMGKLPFCEHGRKVTFACPQLGFSWQCSSGNQGSAHTLPCPRWDPLLLSLFLHLTLAHLRNGYVHPFRAGCVITWLVYGIRKSDPQS